MGDKGNWIVVFKKGTAKETIAGVVAQIEANGGQINHKWYTSDTPALNGFAGLITNSYLETVKKHPELDFVEADAEVSLSNN